MPFSKKHIFRIGSELTWRITCFPSEKEMKNSGTLKQVWYNLPHINTWNKQQSDIHLCSISLVTVSNLIGTIVITSLWCSLFLNWRQSLNQIPDNHINIMDGNKHSFAFFFADFLKLWLNCTLLGYVDTRLLLTIVTS